jgi:hypothetical protein
MEYVSSTLPYRQRSSISRLRDKIADTPLEISTVDDGMYA